jgi:acetate kinase
MIRGKILQSPRDPMKHAMPCVPTIHGGSSSIRFAIYGPVEKGTGKLYRVVLTGTNLSVEDPTGKAINLKPVAARSYVTAVDFLLDRLRSQPSFTSVKAVRSRVVQGVTMRGKKHSEPERITPKLLAELHQIMTYDPEHLPCRRATIQSRQFHQCADSPLSQPGTFEPGERSGVYQ